ncbi:hypothetical protein G8A07_04470 [Roseateles sp. DAIF2]|uniref:hypothetical protein n=1 Tax=Roseateles sp. DAIF2 TaxID=2714952 RepID=UPI0018A2CA9C|nr:hypothetical protein [Roseateles sp. DAIF2]QPF72255.1 hypothetical protein G8A07_04470 [Roseateles sp. DAIF2]
MHARGLGLDGSIRRECNLGKVLAVAALAVVTGVTLPSTAQDLEFKGSKFGDSTAAFQGLQRGYVCMDGRDPCELLVWFIPDGREDATMTYAGEPARGFSARFMNDRLAHVLVHIKPSSYERVVVGLSSKYGKPTRVDRSVVKNRMGTSFQQASSTWVRKDGTIHVLRYGSGLDEGLVSIGSVEWNKDLARREAEAKAKSKIDL